MAFAQKQRRAEGQVAAGAVASDHDAAGIQAPFMAVGGDVAYHGRAFQHGLREASLGRQGVIDAHRGDLGPGGIFAHQFVHGIDRREHPTAAVQPYQNRERSVSVGTMDATEDAAAPRDDPAVEALGHHGAALRPHQGKHLVDGAMAVDRLLEQNRRVRGGGIVHHATHFTYLWVQP